MSDNQQIACELIAINEDELKHHKMNSEELFTSIEQWQELSDGYSFRIPTETKMIERAASFMSRERLCCPFFHFALEVTPGNGPVWLKLTGSEDVKQFVAHNILPQLKTGVNGD
jgi:hypothetical protein